VRTRLAIANAVALLACSLPARAGEPVVHRADEILVEGEAEPEGARVYEDTPGEMETFEREEIESRPGRSAADLLRTLPGVRQQERVQGEGAAVSIEGMPAEYTRALVDGRRYEGEIGSVDDFARLPVADAERVEVLRGVQALRYGSEAAGGVVRIETPTPPRDGFQGWLDGGGGSDNAAFGAASLGLGNPQVGGWLRVVHDSIDGYDLPDEEDLDDGVLVGPGPDSRRTSNDVYGRLRFDPREDLELGTYLGWRRDHETGLLDEPGGSATGQRSEDRWLAAQDFDWRVGEGKLSGEVGWYDDSLDSDVGRSFAMDEDEWSGALAYERMLATGRFVHALTFGVDAHTPHLDLHEAELPPGVPPEYARGPVDERVVTGGIFALTETPLLDTLTLEAGLRGQGHDRFGFRVLPQTSLLWAPVIPDQPLQLLRVRASWGMGWRPPSLRDLYQPPVPQLGGAYFLEGNADLEPESLMTARLGVELSPHSAVALSVVGFANQMHDLIRSVPNGSIPIGTRTVVVCRPVCIPVEVPILAPLFQKENLDDASSYGVETRARWQPHPRVDLQLGYTWLHTQVEDSTVDIDELPNEPHHVFDALVGVTVPWSETTLTAQARWRGRALTETSGTGLLSFASTEMSDPSWIVDLRIVQPLRWGIELYADVLNVNDERVVDSYVVRGRSFFGGLRARFE